MIVDMISLLSISNIGSGVCRLPNNYVPNTFQVTKIRKATIRGNRAMDANHTSDHILWRRHIQNLHLPCQNAHGDLDNQVGLNSD